MNRDLLEKPFPKEIIRESCKNMAFSVVVEMNMGQVLQQVKLSVDDPEKIFLANRVDGELIAPMDIRNILRVIEGKGV